MSQQGLIFGQDYTPPVGWKIPEAGDLPYLTGVTRISLDTETKGKNPFKNHIVGASLAYRTDMLDLKKIYCPVGHAEGNMDPDVVRNWLNYVLQDKEVVFANAKYDIHFLKRFGVDVEKLRVKARDVQFPAALLDDSRNADLSLEAIGQKYVGRGKLKTDLDMNNLDRYPSWMVAPYAEEDAGITLESDEAIQPFIDTEDLNKVLDLENSIIYAVCYIEENGCRIDVEKLERWRKEVRDDYEKSILKIYRATGMMIQVGSGVEMQRLFKRLGLQPPVREKKRKAGQTKEQFEKELQLEEAKKSKKKSSIPTYEVEELLAYKNPVMDEVVNARRYESLLSKFLDKYHDGLDGDILRSKFHQLKTAKEKDEDGNEIEKGGGTISGRFSSSGGGDLSSGYSFNAQQVIRPWLQKGTLGDKWIIRELFTPNEGQKYWSADLSQIEYRVAAHFAGAEKIIKAYQDPKSDFHAITMALVQKYRPDFNDRTRTKNVGFAFVFGSGDETLAETAGITKAEANELLGILKRDAPEFPNLLKRLAWEAEHVGFVKTLYGRRARFGNYEKRYYAALNRVVQGSAADIFKVYLHAVYQEKNTLGITALRQIVHDELNADREPSDTCEIRIKDFFSQQKVDLKVPVVWNLISGNNWAECH